MTAQRPITFQISRLHILDIRTLGRRLRPYSILRHRKDRYGRYMAVRCKILQVRLILQRVRGSLALKTHGHQVLPIRVDARPATNGRDANKCIVRGFYLLTIVFLTSAPNTSLARFRWELMPLQLSNIVFCRAEVHCFRGTMPHGIQYHFLGLALGSSFIRYSSFAAHLFSSTENKPEFQAAQ